MINKCPKNPKSFLGIKYKGSHAWEIISVEPWGAKSWLKYRITGKCAFCGASETTFGVTQTELVNAGIDLEKFKIRA